MPSSVQQEVAFGAAPGTPVGSSFLTWARNTSPIFLHGNHAIPIPNEPMVYFAVPLVIGLYNAANEPQILISDRKLWLDQASEPSVWYGVLSAYREPLLANIPDPTAIGADPTPKGAGAPAAYLPLPVQTEIPYDSSQIPASNDWNGAFVELVFGYGPGRGSFNDRFAMAPRIYWNER